MAQGVLKVYKGSRVVLAQQDLLVNLVTLAQWVQLVHEDQRALLENLVKMASLVEMENLVKWDSQDLRELEDFLELLVFQA